MQDEYLSFVFSGGIAMKIVVVKSPKMLRGLLKLVFKIKDED